MPTQLLLCFSLGNDRKTGSKAGSPLYMACNAVDLWLITVASIELDALFSATFLSVKLVSFSDCYINSLKGERGHNFALFLSQNFSISCSFSRFYCQRTLIW